MKLTGLFRKLQNLTKLYSPFFINVTRQSTDFTLVYAVAEHIVLQLYYSGFQE